MKEVIFHFSPSVRFLGLSLKILFHKNKEIKRMLSKKMTFSLMSLINITCICFRYGSPRWQAESRLWLTFHLGLLAEEHTVTLTLVIT